MLIPMHTASIVFEGIEIDTITPEYRLYKKNDTHFSGKGFLAICSLSKMHWIQTSNFGIEIANIAKINAMSPKINAMRPNIKFIFFRHFFNRTLFLTTTNAMIYSSTFLRTTITNL
jgi:hypothetical protein